jgi:hypothetical protein
VEINCATFSVVTLQLCLVGASNAWRGQRVASLIPSMTPSDGASTQEIEHRSSPPRQQTGIDSATAASVVVRQKRPRACWKNPIDGGKSSRPLAQMEGRSLSTTPIPKRLAQAGIGVECGGAEVYNKQSLRLPLKTLRCKGDGGEVGGGEVGGDEAHLLPIVRSRAQRQGAGAAVSAIREDYWRRNSRQRLCQRRFSCPRLLLQGRLRLTPPRSRRR